MLSAAVWAYACGDGATEPPPRDSPQPTVISVLPRETRLAVRGATVQLSAQVRDRSGQVMADVAVSWSSNDALVASVDGSGLVTAVANGTATITAAAGSASGRATVVVFDSSDRAVMAALYDAMDGPNWVDAENWLTDTPLREWYGVETNQAGRVVGLDLSGQWDGDRQVPIPHGLSGWIPRELGSPPTCTWRLSSAQGSPLRWSGTMWSTTFPYPRQRAQRQFAAARTARRTRAQRRESRQAMMMTAYSSPALPFSWSETSWGIYIAQYWWGSCLV